MAVSYTHLRAHETIHAISYAVFCLKKFFFNDTATTEIYTLYSSSAASDVYKRQITNCTMLSGHGGVVIGSEMSGGVKKVTISNCIFDGTDRGIRLKSTRGRGGIVEDIRVSNIVMRNIKKEAIVLNLKYSKMPAEPKSDRTPEFRNIYVSGVTVRDVNTPIMVVGLPEAPITGIVMRDVYIQNAKQRCVFEDCKDLVLDDVYVDGKEIK